MFKYALFTKSIVLYTKQIMPEEAKRKAITLSIINTNFPSKGSLNTAVPVLTMPPHVYRAPYVFISILGGGQGLYFSLPNCPTGRLPELLFASEDRASRLCLCESSWAADRTRRRGVFFLTRKHVTLTGRFLEGCVSAATQKVKLLECGECGIFKATVYQALTLSIPVC